MDLRLRAVTRTFRGPVDITAIDGLDLDVRSGEFLAIVGPSGGGKSTLLNLLGLLDRPDRGTYEVSGSDTSALRDDERARLRSRRFGFVFQSFHLLDDRPTVDSVELALLYRAVPRAERRVRARAALERVGLEGAGDQRASQLSGGQRQRVAIARALAASAEVIVADEPTGNLDSTNGERIIRILLGLRDEGCTVVLVTHDLELARRADRVAHVRDGRLTRIEQLRAAPAPAPAPAPPPAPTPAPTPTPTPAPTNAPDDATAHPEPATARPDPIAGRPSSLRPVDALRDAFATVSARAGRTAGLVGAVATAVGLAVASIGISNSASAQVSTRFDLHANRDVTVSSQRTADTDAPSNPDEEDLRGHARSLLRRSAQLAGVDAAAVTYDRGSTTTRATPQRPELQVPATSVVGDIVGAARLTIEWAPNHPKRLAADEVLIGRSLADQLPLGTVAAGPVIEVAGADVVVAGVITKSPRVPSYLGGVMSSGHDSPSFEAPSRMSVLLRTASGGAQQVARQAAVALDPVAPDSMTVDAPSDPTSLRSEIETDVRSTLLAFTVIALLAAVAALGNAMLLGVLERRAEFGLRRAVGARPVHVAALVLCESAIIGALGGIAGLVGGLGTVLGITVARQWVPVFDLWLTPAAIGGGIVVGCLGGLVAAWRATRIEPQEALRG